ncbi:MAG TPA: Rpn family recombination-promoting nuclease/putative transposase, partial [Spirochaetota bacterium]|nr:Rpn family recombination-promoting nuclease/putative transposase [Spirochaetota bacterium]
MENFHTHDRGYKYLFSHPMLVKELLESFVGMDWIQEIDFSKAVSVNTSFVSDEFKNRESDIIYRLKFRGKELYLFLLIEFQSTVDRYMALRMLRYVVELYEYLIRNKKAASLPVIFPVLLYNGEGKWTAPDRLSKLIDVPKELKQAKLYMPEFRYFPVIENEYSEKTLLKLGNIVSSVFFFENCDKERFRDAIE